MPIPAVLAGIASSIIGGIFKTVDEVVEDKDEANRLKAQLQSKVMDSTLVELESATKIIVAEAQGGSWIQRSWRPLTMLTFVGLIVAKWLGFTAPGISEAIELALFDIIKIGLGGYVLGRSGEKIVKTWKQND